MLIQTRAHTEKYDNFHLHQYLLLFMIIVTVQNLIRTSSQRLPLQHRVKGASSVDRVSVTVSMVSCILTEQDQASRHRSNKALW